MRNAPLAVHDSSQEPERMREACREVVAKLNFYQFDVMGVGMLPMGLLLPPPNKLDLLSGAILVWGCFFLLCGLIGLCWTHYREWDLLWKFRDDEDIWLEDIGSARVTRYAAGLAFFVVCVVARIWMELVLSFLQLDWDSLNSPL